MRLIVIMTEQEDKFLRFLQGVLFPKGEPRPIIPEKDVNELLKIAKKQALLGLFTDYLLYMNTVKNDTLTMKLIATLTQIKRINLLMNQELENFVKLLSKEQIRAIVVKGQTVASLYPDPLLRQSGDIDFYGDEPSRKKLMDVLQKNYGITPQQSSAKHQEYELNGIRYELHSRLVDFSFTPHQKYWDKLIEKELEGDPYTVTIGNTEIPTLSPNLNAIYLFIHIFFHLISSGIGLRQFCDWALFLHRHDKEIDREKLSRDLGRLGIKYAYKALGGILIDYVGLSEEEFPLKLTKKDKKSGKKILYNIFRMGNFGQETRHVPRLGLLHSLETGVIAARQSIRFISLAPAEVLLKVPKMIKWFFCKQ